MPAENHGKIPYAPYKGHGDDLPGWGVRRVSPVCDEPLRETGPGPADVERAAPPGTTPAASGRPAPQPGPQGAKARVRCHNARRRARRHRRWAATVPTRACPRRPGPRHPTRRPVRPPEEDRARRTRPSHASGSAARRRGRRADASCTSIRRPLGFGGTIGRKRVSISRPEGTRAWRTALVTNSERTRTAESSSADRPHPASDLRNSRRASPTELGCRRHRITTVPSPTHPISRPPRRRPRAARCRPRTRRARSHPFSTPLQSDGRAPGREAPPPGCAMYDQENRTAIHEKRQAWVVEGGEPESLTV